MANMAMKTEDRLLNSIIPYFKDQNFDQRFKVVTQSLSKSRRFLLKMELNRLFSACKRTIDLRGKVDGTCQEYQFQGKTHYLDTLAIENFEEVVAIFDGFTVGVFERVTQTENSYRVKQLAEDTQRRQDLERPQSKSHNTSQSQIREEPAKEQLHQTELVSLTTFNQRSEDRVAIIDKLQVRLRNGHQVDGVSSNLSINGCKVKIPSKYQVAVGETIYLNYLKIERNDEQKHIKDI